MIRALGVFKKAFSFFLNHGLAGTIREISKRLGGRFLGRIAGQQDVLNDFSFASMPAFSPKANGAPHNTVNWYIPVVGKGSGGHGNIFRFIRALEETGIESRIVIVGPNVPKSAKIAAEEIRSWFFDLKATVFLWGEEIPEAHLGMATEWRTAYFLRNSQLETERAYFIQDFEPWFFPRGSLYALAEQTYRFGFKAVTAGSWLSSLVREEYGMEAISIGFPADLSIYGKHSDPKSDGTTRVFFYARPPTPRRDFELGMLALHRLTSTRPDIEVVFAGWDLSNYKIPFRHKSLGTLREEQLPGVYAQVDIALVISATNLSLLPVDLMASGVPIVSNSGPNVEWLLNESNAYLCELDPESIVSTLLLGLDNKVDTRRRVEKAKKDISEISWSSEAQRATKFLGLAK
jgi:glycosyltransferase involved in cell wall biosynthesis